MAAGNHATPRAAGRSPLLVIFLTVFIDLLGFGIVIPLLPIYSKVYDASELQLGLLFASFSAMQFVFAPFWGRLSDRIGRRPVLIGGLCGTSAAYVLFAFADSMPLLFAARLLSGFFGANISTAAAYIADVTTPENRAKGMGLIGAAFGLGFTLGPLLGGELTSVSVHLPGLVAAALSAFAALFGFFKLVEPERERRTGSRVFGTRELRHAASEARIGWLYLLGFLGVFAFSAFESMFARYGLARFPEQFGLPQAIEHATLDQVLAAARPTGRYLCMIGVVSALIQGGLIRRLVPRFGETTLTAAGMLALTVALTVLGCASDWATVVVACLLLPLGIGLYTPSVQGLISRATPPAEQGAYLGLLQSASSFARLSGPVVAGYAFGKWGASSPFLLGAAVVGIAAALAMGYHRRFGASFARVAPGSTPEAAH